MSPEFLKFKNLQPLLTPTYLCNPTILSRVAEPIRKWLFPTSLTDVFADKFGFQLSVALNALQNVTPCYHSAKEYGYVRCLMIDFSCAFDVHRPAL